MRVVDLIEHSYVSDLKRQIKDALVALKAMGVKEIQTDKVMKEFAQKGIKISLDELIDLVGHEDMIEEINKYKITFADIPTDTSMTSADEVEKDQQKVEKMALKALRKRI